MVLKDKVFQVTFDEKGNLQTNACLGYLNKKTNYVHLVKCYLKLDVTNATINDTTHIISDISARLYCEINDVSKTTYSFPSGGTNASLVYDEETGLCCATFRLTDAVSSTKGKVLCTLKLCEETSDTYTDSDDVEQTIVAYDVLQPFYYLVEEDSAVTTPTDEDDAETIDDIQVKMTACYIDKHTHTNKEILDNTTASFTTELKNKLDGIESGATNREIAINKSKQLPIEIASVSNLPASVNVNTYKCTDSGHWYFSNGTIWVDGGLYQAMEIADESVNYSKLGQDVKNTISNINNQILSNSIMNIICADDFSFTGYINETNGTLHSGDTYKSTDFIMLSETTYTTNLPLVRVAYYDKNKTFIKIKNVTTTNTSFTTDGAVLFRFSILASYDLNTLMITNGNYVSSTYYPKNKIISLDVNLPNEKYENVFFQNFSTNIVDESNDFSVIGYLNGDGAKVNPNTSFKTTKFIKLYNDNFVCNYKVSRCRFYDENYNLILKYQDDVTAGTVINKPTNAMYIKISVATNCLVGSFMLVNGIKLPNTYLSHLKIESLSNSPFTNKVMSCLGDSMVTQERWQPTTKSILGLSNYFITGNAGYSVSKVIYKAVPNINSTSDFLIIWCGTNDWTENVQLGNKNDIGNGIDNTTFYGAWNYMLKYIGTNFPTMKVLILTPMQRYNADDISNETAHGYDELGNIKNNIGLTLLDYVNAEVIMAQKYGYPVVNMYADANINKYNLSTYSGDMIHMNTLNGAIYFGKFIAKMIQDKIVFD